MKLSALTYLIIGIVFGIIAVFFGVIKEYSVNTPGVLNQFVHADASIYACGLIAAACFVTSGIVLIHTYSRERIEEVGRPPASLRNRGSNLP